MAEMGKNIIRKNLSTRCPLDGEDIEFPLELKVEEGVNQGDRVKVRIYARTDLESVWSHFQGNHGVPTGKVVYKLFEMHRGYLPRVYGTEEEIRETIERENIPRYRIVKTLSEIVEEKGMNADE